MDSAKRNLAAIDLDPVERSFLLRRVGTEDLLSLRWVVIVPKPSQGVRQFSAPIRGMMAGVSEYELVIVFFDFQRIGKIDIF